ncbi:MAG: 2Fe-2S iron-sulfur cluster-binding protein [Streptosporangiaceae bacterium]
MPEADGGRPETGESESYELTFEFPDGHEETAKAGRDEYILSAARRHGLELPSLCEQGWDLACAVRVLEGDCDNGDARRYFEQDRADGFALICTAKPRSDLRLRTHQRRAMRDARVSHGLPAPRAV